MASPPLRLLLVVVVALSLAGVTATSARADEHGARGAAATFLDALLREDSRTACGLFTAATLERLGGAERCDRMFGPSSDRSDYEAMSTLNDAFLAAEKSAVKRRGQFVNRTFTAKALAKDMERVDEDLTVRLGRDSRAAVGQLASTVILDRRSTARRVVLYVESDDGSIFRLSGAMLGDPDIREVGQGTPEVAPQAPTGRTWYELGETTIRGDTMAWVNAIWLYQDEERIYRYEMVIVLASDGDGYRVHDIYYSMASDSESG